MSPNNDFLIETHGFDDWEHFHKVRQLIENAVAAGMLTEVPSVGWYGVPMFEQRWFRTQDGVVWCLVTPDPPFTGVLEVVKDSSKDSSEALESMQEAAYRSDFETVQASWERLATEAPEAVAHDLCVHLAQQDEWNRRHPVRHRMRELLKRLGIFGRRT